MIQVERAWREREHVSDVVEELEHDLGISRLVARLLTGRGIRDHISARRFLDRRLADLHPPETMRDMDPAARRFAAAINQRQGILIHGDYDVDGCTATALLKRFCQACGHDAIAWIPDRRIDGYGLGEASLEAVREFASQLMITVDCGINDEGWATRIETEAGCDVIITDHHLPGVILPRCRAVVNPNRPDCPHPDKGLAGVGVAWKLCWATAKILCGADRVSNRLREFLLDGLALVSLGTVADCAPLSGENRILVHHGLDRLSRSENPGIKSLLVQTQLTTPIDAGAIGWRLAPLLNAAGRMGSAMPNVELLTTTDPLVARQRVAALVKDNEERRRLTGILTEDLCCEVDGRADRYDHRASLVLAGEGWHPGIIGIVAARLAERFGRPAAVIAIEDGIGKGSLRSVPSVHLGAAIDACRSHLLGGGGHAMAAGISLAVENIPAFVEAFDAAIRNQHPAGLPGGAIDHDGTVTVAELDDDLFAALEQLAPFGNDNPEPVLRVNDAFFVTPPSFIGQGGNHLRGALTDQGGGTRQILIWNARNRYEELARRGQRFDLLVRPEINHFRNRREHRLVYVDGVTVDRPGSATS